MIRNSLEHHSVIYWSLCRQFRNNRWNLLATERLGYLLKSPYDRIKVAACDLWYRIG